MSSIELVSCLAPRVFVWVMSLFRLVVKLEHLRHDFRRLLSDRLGMEEGACLRCVSDLISCTQAADYDMYTARRRMPVQ